MQLATLTSEPVKWLSSDNQFHHLYPQSIKVLASKHWTPLEVSRKAASFLAVRKGCRILDIGSGVGKFCLCAAITNPHAHFYGVEQRKDLITHAETAKAILGVPNAHFIHGNFTQLKMKEYDHFYFYNSFYENLAGTNKIDDSIAYSGELYNYYNSFLYRQLEKMPGGTRLVTYHSLEDEVPRGFLIVGAEMDNLLKYWIKE